MKRLLSIMIFMGWALVVSGQVSRVKTSACDRAGTQWPQYRDTALVAIDTIKANNHQYARIMKAGRFNCLLTVQGDTVVPAEDYYFKLEFPDINEDGFSDIRVFIFSNTPNQCDNYLFDREAGSFRQIEDCGLDIQKLKGTQFYYSYNRAGCADMNWESHLGKIEGYKLVSYGAMYGNGCDDEGSDKRVIRIYKVNDIVGDETFVETLPYHEYIHDGSDKWTFMGDYWRKNAGRFERKRKGRR